MHLRETRRWHAVAPYDLLSSTMSGLERTIGDASTAMSSMHESAAWKEFDTSTMNCNCAIPYVYAIWLQIATGASGNRPAGWRYEDNGAVSEVGWPDGDKGATNFAENELALLENQFFELNPNLRGLSEHGPASVHTWHGTMSRRSDRPR